MAVITYTKAGAKATTAAKLDKAVFGVAPKSHELLKQAYVSYLSNGRENNAVVKTRGLVSGGGRKPWKQKGTGRARFGSSRVPIWRGGGIVFGPTGEENYTKKMNTKAKRLAIRQALSIAADENKIVILESFAPKDGKTSEAAKLLAKLGAAKNILLVVENKTPEIVRATANIKNVIVTQATYVNTYDVINADSIIITSEALKLVHVWLSPDAATSDKEGEK